MTQFPLNQLTNHIYWTPPDPRTDRPILGAIVGSGGTVVVDAGNSVAHATLLLERLAERPIKPPSFLVLTHWHWDHVFGAVAFDLPTFAHVETKRVVEEMAGLDWSDAALDARVEAGVEIEFCRDMIKVELPDRTDLQIRPPNIGFTDQVDLDLGDVICQLIHVGGDHAADSIIVHIPQERVVFLGDCAYPNLYAPQPTYTPAKLFPLIDRLLSLEADFYIQSHHPAPTPRTEFEAEMALLQTVGHTVKRLSSDRERILREIDQPIDEAELGEIVDAFIAGLSIDH